MTIRNDGVAGSSLVVSSVAVSGTGFTRALGTCGPLPRTLAVGASCSVSVSFRPTAPGPHNGSLVFSHNAGSGSTTVALSGNGVGSGISADPARLDFGRVPVAGGTAVMTVTVRNNDTVSRTISRLSKGGNHPGDFIIGNDQCTGRTLAGGGTCTFTVTFNPSATGTRSAVIRIFRNGSSTALRVPVRGIGT